MWQCSKCGKTREDGILFCEACGDFIEQKTRAPASAKEEKGDQASSKEGIEVQGDSQPNVWLNEVKSHLFALCKMFAYGILAYVIACLIVVLWPLSLLLLITGRRVITLFERCVLAIWWAPGAVLVGVLFLLQNLVILLAGFPWKGRTAWDWGVFPLVRAIPRIATGEYFRVL